MDRLIAEEPLYSDGKLTIKSLAEEARIKRWLLTHRHTDLQSEFRARISNTPPALVALRDERDDAQRRIEELTSDVTALQGTVHQLERIIHVLALETISSAKVSAQDELCRSDHVKDTNSERKRHHHDHTKPLRRRDRNPPGRAGQDCHLIVQQPRLKPTIFGWNLPNRVKPGLNRVKFREIYMIGR
ncbi:hypothetical protein [Rhodococcus sp. NCIMB 12038]|uniref:hypothetical protein n=1 Tax=Rhodococcus sp. NCIMB 12038 TaxID=933800 RepID=UPI0015C65E47|nr:hypothetical protein [Rhodococcus sp. NCIMB 12038]